MTQMATADQVEGAEQRAQEVVAEIQKEGFCVVPGVFSPEECRAFVDILERTVSELAASGGYYGSNSTQVIYNYFLHDDALLRLFSHPLMDAVMTTLIDKDYVLISPSARNPRIKDDLPPGKKTSGSGWHIDSRIAVPQTGELFKPSLSYYSVVALEPFTADNSATRYVPRSHLLYKKPPSRDVEMENEILQAAPGSVVFFDSALWHRAGDPTTTSRWSIFNMYGPWFMKPYFRFRDNYSTERMEALSPLVQRLLHFRSTPPKDSSNRTITVTDTVMFD